MNWSDDLSNEMVPEEEMLEPEHTGQESEQGLYHGR
jgi:hypothetical protein